MKTLLLEPINESIEVKTDSLVLDALLAKELNVPMACKGKGICATCHVFVKKGAENITPRTARETKTLSMISGTKHDSRLACQCRILGEGVVVVLPEGMYIERAEDLLDLIGTRAHKDILHPINGLVLIAKGKIITRSRIEELKRLNFEIGKDVD